MMRGRWFTSSRRRASRACSRTRSDRTVERINATSSFRIDVPLAHAVADGDSTRLRVSVLALVCREESSVCFIKSVVFNVPVKFSSAKKAGEPIRLVAPVAVGRG